MGTSYFIDFQPEELDLVLSMPYRIGVWVSNADNVDGTSRDESREAMAQEQAMEWVRKQAGTNSFVAAIVSEILKHRQFWPAWDGAASFSLDDLPRALALIDDRLPRAEAAQYRKCIFHIAKRVAMAANEGADAHEDLSSHMFGGKLIAKVTDWLAAKSDEAVPENISPAEKDALRRLLQLLKA